MIKSGDIIKIQDNPRDLYIVEGIMNTEMVFAFEIHSDAVIRIPLCWVEEATDKDIIKALQLQMLHQEYEMAYAEIVRE